MTLQVPMSQKQIKSFQESNSRINIFEGSVRAGKSFIALVRWLEFIRSGPAGPLVACGRTDATIKRNIVDPLFDLVGPSGLRYFPGKRELHIYGRVMMLIGANDDRAEAKIRGSEIVGALLDEITILPESFVKMLLSRMSIRGAKLFATTNPDSPYHWVKKDLIDRRNELDCSVFSFRLDDNPSLDPSFKEALKKEYSGLWYKRFIEGQWVVAEGAVYDFFDEEVHTIKFPPHNPREYIVGVDYGTTNPTVFSLIGYSPNSYPNIWLQEEYYYDSKEHNRQKSDFEYAEDFKKFIDGKHISAIYIDPSAASFKQELYRNGITNICDADNDVLSGIRFTSNLLTSGALKICQQCTRTIREFGAYVWDARATKLGKDAPMKVSDHCFCCKTPILTDQGYKPIESLRKGDNVLTTIGYQPIVETFEREADCYEFDILGKTLACTYDHKMYLANLDDYKEINKIGSRDIQLIYLGEGAWSQQQGSMEQLSEDIQTQKTELIESISRLQKENIEEDICIESYGNESLEKFQKDAIFITKTKTQQTIALAISSAAELSTIFPSMAVILQKIKEELSKKTSLICLKKQSNGTKVEREVFGIVDMQKRPMQRESINPAHVFSVENPSQVETQKKQSFVAISVRLQTDGEVRLIMRKENALFAESFSLETNTTKENSAQSRAEGKPIGRQKVYNLHIANKHEYFADGILSKNCMDSLRYGVFSHFFSQDAVGYGMSKSDAKALEDRYKVRMY